MAQRARRAPRLYQLGAPDGKRSSLFAGEEEACFVTVFFPSDCLLRDKQQSVKLLHVADAERAHYPLGITRLSERRLLGEFP
ncbi:MAG: hypothetical protein QOK43_345 [Acidimicrobiaceae bacterium]|nr:hypothetical protein [Acidimicrobiaceae bacterium]